MATLVIGDIQGCIDELRALLRMAQFDPRNDRLWLTGDLVNRGPRSLEVLRFVRNLGNRAIVVLGNHDLHLVALACGHARHRTDDTLRGVLEAPDAPLLIDWLRARPLLHREGARVLVHAGLLPQWSIAQAAALAQEVHTALRAANYGEFLAHMYGSKPDRWDDSLSGYDRLRVIVNAMTRLRFCTREGVMDFHAKGGLDTTPRGHYAWFEVPGRRSARATIVCGHWSALGLRLERNLIALDTGCVWGGALSAVRLEDRKLFQVPCRRPASAS
jgi:bis(5'-nucleosyl)-tetraphosphatase (symmetrical)